jgi:hypothetical protein
LGQDDGYTAGQNVMTMLQALTAAATKAVFSKKQTDKFMMEFLRIYPPLPPYPEFKAHEGEKEA